MRETLRLQWLYNVLFIIILQPSRVISDTCNIIPLNPFIHNNGLSLQSY